MRPIAELLRLNKKLRVIGFDDAPFDRARGSVVNVSGIVCAQTRFEGMLYGETVKDGDDATQLLVDMLCNSKFASQINLILTDGIAFGGFNIIDLPQLAQQTGIPCIAVMRKQPDMAAIDNALVKFDDYAKRKATLLKAGEIYQHHPFYFQCQGIEPDIAVKALTQCTDTGHVPEALRLAHLIGSAIKTGQSSSRA